ncbi:MAG: neutral/alkaline non-lysosomal ceramidase N-terminal domain-containing protein [Clostridia bacterium]|nr:neutral/alkaline non-lysosomal ceramidase N-terminal domain-containing protein [Clostridia bacterium]
MKENLFLGVARRTITPKVGTYLYGYRPNHASESVNDDLTATAFYFAQGGERALLVSVTVCEVHRDIVNEIVSAVEKKHGIARSSIILHSIHTHSGPNLIGTFGWGDIDTVYRDEIFVPEVLAAIDGAVANVQPVTMAIASGKSLVGVNRRELGLDNEVGLGQCPWGPFDPQMTILSFRGEGGACVANLIHYGAHPTASGMNVEITRDWPGVMMDALEEKTGGVTAFINGPEGDVGPRLANGWTTADLPQAMAHGKWAGEDACRIYEEMGAYHTPRLASFGGEVVLPLMPRISLAEAKAEYENYKGSTSNSLAQRANYYKKVIASYEEGYVEEATRAFHQTIIRLGDVAIVSFPFELFSEIGLRIKKASDVPYVLSLALANGSSGYFATESDLCRGGYEIIMSRTANVQAYAPNADWYVVTGTVENLKKTED